VERTVQHDDEKIDPAMASATTAAPLTGSKGGSEPLADDEPAQVGKMIGDLQRLGLKPLLRRRGRLQFQDLLLHRDVAVPSTLTR
jgi:hypothetical protein